MAERHWDTLYVMVDAHGTLIRPGHDHVEFYPCAVEVMKWFNHRKDFKVILWTSSHKSEIKMIVQACNEAGFAFDFINCNLAEKDSPRACFEKKFYFNIILDDKAGFEPEFDWLRIKYKLQDLKQWDMTTATETTLDRKRAIYVGETPLVIDEQILSYGMTGYYQEKFAPFSFGSFYSDDVDMPVFVIDNTETQLYFPTL